jgi:glucose-1-phosphate adenylyltransferase
MDLLGAHPALTLSDESWRIYSRHTATAPQYVGKNAIIENSSITEGCEIYGTVRNSVLGTGVKVLEGAVVEDSVIFDDVIIGENAKISYSIIDSNVTVGASSSIGRSKDEAKGITVIGTKIDVPFGTEVADAKMIYTASDLKEEV